MREEDISSLPVRRSTATRLHLETVGILFAPLLGKVRKGSQDAKVLLPLDLVTCRHGKESVLCNVLATITVRVK